MKQEQVYLAARPLANFRMLLPSISYLKGGNSLVSFPYTVLDQVVMNAVQCYYIMPARNDHS